MNLGDVVIVLGDLDKRIRDKRKEGLVLGTLEQFIGNDQVSVILEDMDIWVGLRREIAPYKEGKE